MQVNKVVITLTTVPERLSQDSELGLKSVIKSLCEQNYSNYEVHFNIPEFYSLTKESYIIPEWLNVFLNSYINLKVFRVEDIGPPTKVIPTILREDKNTLIIVVDDDLIYHPDMIIEHVKYHNLFSDSVILYDGRNSVSPKYGDLRDSWVLTVKEPTEVKMLQHYKSVSYYGYYFDEKFFTDFLGKTLSDDVLMSYYFKYKNIKMIVVPYDNDIQHIQTYNDWYNYQGVTTFPVIRHSDSVMNTGCNNTKILEKEPKFFIPKEFSKYE
jgi:hypothetical protein